LERVVEALAVGHVQRGHDVAVATILFDEEPHPLVVALRQSGVGVFEVHVRTRAYLTERRAIRNICRTFRPDVVHTHGYRPDVVDRPVAAQLGLPTVTTVHGPSMNGGLKGAFYEWLQWSNYRRFDAVVAVSDDLHAGTLARGVHPDKLHLVPNAWGNLHVPLTRTEARGRLGLDPDATVVGWVGRLLPVKGADLFIRAFAHLPDPRPRGVIIGHGAEKDALQAEVRTLGLDETISFHPDITDAGRYFSAFDVYVLSSRSEGLPVTLLEAMATRVPIVAARVGGVPEAIRESDGLLVSPEDPLELAQAITFALSDRAAAAGRVTSASERLVDAFSFAPWLEKYEQVYGSVTRADCERGQGRPRLKPERPTVP